MENWAREAGKDTVRWLQKLGEGKVDTQNGNWKRE
jgi:hypothetical protein